MYKVVLTLGLAAVLAVSGCSRQQSDWEKTRAANTTDDYELFLKKYPQGEFTAQAQARVKELYEERDWQKARDIDSVEAYQAFLKQYPEGKWSEEARIRIENFTLASAPSNAVSGAPANGQAAGAAAPAPQDSSPTALTAQKPAKKPLKSDAAASPKPSGASAGADTSTGGSGSGNGNGNGSGAYGVQLGAFKSGAAAANERWEHLSAKYPKVLAGLSPQVSPRQDSKGTMYRLHVENLSDKRAHAICKSLRAHSQACMVLAPAHRKSA
jgi:SPOR domain